jgi:hypothetical protein
MTFFGSGKKPAYAKATARQAQRFVAPKAFRDRRGCRSYGALRVSPRSAHTRSKHHWYLTEQPYGRVFAVVTGLPASDSSSATLT